MIKTLHHMHPAVKRPLAFGVESVTEDFSIATNGICLCDDLHHPTRPCGADSLCDGCDTTIYGQDEHWVRANFDRLRALDPALTSAEDILAVGYANWVDARVGYGLENGLYKFTASFADDPLERVDLTVGDLTVAVTDKLIGSILDSFNHNRFGIVSGIPSAWYFDRA